MRFQIYYGKGKQFLENILLFYFIFPTKHQQSRLLDFFFFQKSIKCLISTTVSFPPILKYFEIFLQKVQQQTFQTFFFLKSNKNHFISTTVSFPALIKFTVSHFILFFQQKSNDKHSRHSFFFFFFTSLTSITSLDTVSFLDH